MAEFMGQTQSKGATGVKNKSGTSSLTLSSLLDKYQPDNIAVTWENVGGREINLRKTLCGYSFEPDLATSDRKITALNFCSIRYQ